MTPRLRPVSQALTYKDWRLSVQLFLRHGATFSVSWLRRYAGVTMTTFGNGV